MTRTTLEVPIWRYPGAELADEGRWVAFTGEPEAVLPAGLTASDAGGELAPRHLRSTVGDSFDSFRLLASLDDADHPAHLRDYVRNFGASPLCVHGLPALHLSKPGGCAVPEVPGVAAPVTGLSVAHAAALARVVDALLDASVRTRRRQPLPRHIVQTLGEGPFVPAIFASVVDAELQGGRLSVARQRRLVSVAAEGFLTQTKTTSGVSWVGYRRPELVMKAAEVWGVYALEVIRRLTLDDSRPPAYECSVCSGPVRLSRRPRDGDGIYCDTPECQRERWRRNKSKQRQQHTEGTTT